MSTNFLKTGFWIDYSKASSARAQILLEDYWAGVLTNAVAVLITSTSGPIFTLLIGPISFLWDKVPSRLKGRNAALARADGYHEIVHDAMMDLLDYIPLRPRGNHHRIPLDDDVVIPRRRRDGIEAVGAGSLIVIFLGLLLAIIVASILSVGIATDTTAISNSPKCGLYKYDPESRRMLGGSLEFEHRAETQSAAYAADCYGSSPLNAACPFSGDVCKSGKRGAFKLSTGLVSGAVLGINAVNPFFFSRTTICSPLVTGEKYVGIGMSPQGEAQWEYWYGPSLGSYTSANPVRVNSWEIKGYSTGIHCSNPTFDDGSFKPMPEFTAGPYPVTLIFISSHNILYHERRKDPIFPALQKANFPPTYRGPDLFYNNSTRAGVLGCTDQYQICITKSGPCWDNGNITKIFNDDEAMKSAESQNVTRLLLLALKYSSTCGSVQFRSAEALDAQKKIAHMQSLPLANQQWKVEAQSSFRTSLARMQLNVFDVVRGSASNFRGYRDKLPPKHRGLCQMVKIKGSGVKNISFSGLLGTVFAVGIVWTISRKIQTGSHKGRPVAVLIWERCWRPGCGWICALFPCASMVVHFASLQNICAVHQYNLTPTQPTELSMRTTIDVGKGGQIPATIATCTYSAAFAGK
ncbi:hypothetical protein DL95DRAFT_467570 [Leptodontidium sp. 2 PMI_412]|nr:hypothetical protein DL95DRAFT_467570 [Leptodontidium sp. 2 PMI_412]